MSAPDLIIVGGRLWSRGRRLPVVDAVSVRAGRIVRTGAAADLMATRGPETRVVEAHGGSVTPGFADAHIHLVQWARGRSVLDLEGATSRNEVARRVAQRASGDVEPVIVGRGWDANHWSEGPERGVLDRVVRDRPVLLYSHDLHNLWVNGAALAAAGIGPATPDPDGGTIERDAAGAPTGLLREHAMRLCSGLDRADPGRDHARLEDAARALHAFGITAVHDLEGADAHRMLRRLSAGDAPLRVLMHIPHADLEHALGLGISSGFGDDTFRIGAVKLFADGTLGSRTAALLDPYDGTDERGRDLLPPAGLAALVRRAVEGGISVAVHAIGDRAVRSALDAFEAVRDRIPVLALPPRIEHVQLLHPDDLPRFAALGVAASVQPIHQVADIPLAERWWGSRLGRSYPWGSLLESGALVAFGSDAPVESPNPALGLHAARFRRAVGAGPERALAPGQCIDLDAALSAYTEGPARLSGAWPRLGCLDPGSMADCVVWDADLHALADDALAGARPLMTVVGGEVVYEAARERATGSQRPGNGST